MLRDSKDRIWVTVSTKVKNWMHALRTDLRDGHVVCYEKGRFRIVVEGFGFTNGFVSMRGKNISTWSS